MNRRLVFFLLLLLLLATPAVLTAEVLGAGEPLPAMQLADQHDNAHTLADAAVIVFAPDKAASEIAHLAYVDVSAALSAAPGLEDPA